MLTRKKTPRLPCFIQPFPPPPSSSFLLHHPPSHHSPFYRIDHRRMTCRNCAVCGALVGAKIGYTNLPRDWLMAMPHKKWLDQKVVALLKLMGLVNKPQA